MCVVALVGITFCSMGMYVYTHGKRTDRQTGGWLAWPHSPTPHLPATSQAWWWTHSVLAWDRVWVNGAHRTGQQACSSHDAFPSPFTWPWDRDWVWEQGRTQPAFPCICGCGACGLVPALCLFILGRLLQQHSTTTTPSYGVHVVWLNQALWAGLAVGFPLCVVVWGGCHPHSLPY